MSKKKATLAWSASVGDYLTAKPPKEGSRSDHGRTRMPVTKTPEKPRKFSRRGAISRFKKDRREALPIKKLATMGDEEVRFWMFAGSDHREDADEIAPDLKELDLTADVPFETAVERFKDFCEHGSWWHGESNHLISLYLRFYPWGDVFQMALEHGRYDRRECLEVMPNPDDAAELERIRPDIIRRLENLPDGDVGDPFVALTLEFFPHADTAQRYFQHVSRWWVTNGVALLKQLPTSKEAYKTARRLKLTLNASTVAELVEHFGYEGVSDLVKACDPKVASVIRSPKAVDAWLDWATKGKNQDYARHFLTHEGCNAIDGMLSFLARRGKKRDMSVKLLAEMVESGHGAIIADVARSHPAKVQEKLTSDVLTAAEGAVEELPQADWPDWMVTAAKQQVGRDKVKKVLGTGRLEQVFTRDGKHRVPEDVLLGYLAMVASTVDDTVELTGIDMVAAGRMAWAFIERWLQKDKPSWGQWTLRTLLSLGGDPEAAKLGREARKNNFHRGELSVAVEVLTAMDSRDSLTALHRMTNKWPARSALEDIRKKKRMSEARFLDAIVPTCGLSDLHTIDLDFGARMFTLALTPPSKVLIVDADSGEVFQKFPPRRKADDPDKHKAAQGVYKLFKKELAEVVEAETKRLEQAMLSARTWTRKDWLDDLSHHPVMGPLACTLVWKTWRHDTLVTFMPTHPDDSCINVSYDEVALGDTIAIAHPVDCSEHERDAWNELLTDSEIVQPFAQLGRSCYVPGSTRSDAFITRLKARKFSDQELRDGLYGCGYWGVEGKDYNYDAFQRTVGHWRVVVELSKPVPRWSWPPSGPDYAITDVVFEDTSGGKKTKGKRGLTPPDTIYSESLLALESLDT